jgi:hypothetical protein
MSKVRQSSLRMAVLQDPSLFSLSVSLRSLGRFARGLAFIVGEDMVDVYQITIQYENKSEAIQSLYFKINDWAQAGLDKQSYVDTIEIVEYRAPLFLLCRSSAGCRRATSRGYSRF